MEVRSTLTQEEAVMETMTVPEVQVREECYLPAAPPASRRRGSAARIVTGLYVLLVLSAPLIVRYGPDLVSPSAPAAVAVHETVAPRCASAPNGQGCKGGDALLNARRQK